MLDTNSASTHRKMLALCAHASRVDAHGDLSPEAESAAYLAGRKCHALGVDLDDAWQAWGQVEGRAAWHLFVDGWYDHKEGKERA